MEEFGRVKMEDYKKYLVFWTSFKLNIYKLGTIMFFNKFSERKTN